MTDGGGAPTGLWIRYGTRADGPYSEEDLRAAVGRVPDGVEVLVDGVWVPLAEGLTRIPVAPGATKVARPDSRLPAEPSAPPHSGSSVVEEPPGGAVDGPISRGFAYWFRRCYLWTLALAALVAVGRATSLQGSGLIDSAFEIGFNGVFWAAVVAAFLAWRSGRARGTAGAVRTSRAESLAGALNLAGPSTPSDRVLWDRRRPTERVTFKSHAGVMSYRRVIDGALYVTNERMMFVRRDNQQFHELVGERNVTLGRRSWLNAFVTIDDVEILLPNREVPALQRAVRTLRFPTPPQGGSPAPNSNPAPMHAGHGPQSAPENGLPAPQSSQSSARGPLTAIGLSVAVLLIAAVAIPLGAGLVNQGTRSSPSSGATQSSSAADPGPSDELHVGSCLEAYGTEYLIRTDCMDPDVQYVVTEFQASSAQCEGPSPYPLRLGPSRYACLMERDHLG